jgi:hypothetical protein
MVLTPSDMAVFLVLRPKHAGRSARLREPVDYLEYYDARSSLLLQD